MCEIILSTAFTLTLYTFLVSHIIHTRLFSRFSTTKSKNNFFDFCSFFIRHISEAVFFLWEMLVACHNERDLSFYYPCGDIWSLQFRQDLTHTQIHKALPHINNTLNKWWIFYKVWTKNNLISLCLCTQFVLSHIEYKEYTASPWELEQNPTALNLQPVYPAP